MDFPSHTDEALLRLTSREPDAFGVFYTRHERAVLRYFLARGCRAEAAVDLTAETFAAALVACHRFRPGPQPATAWLFGIAWRILAQSHRRGRVDDRARRRLAMPRLEITDDLLERVERLTSADSTARLQKLVEALPSEQREAVHARVVDERAYAEIARDLGCSEAVVRKRVSRALASLRGQMEAE